MFIKCLQTILPHQLHYTIQYHHARVPWINLDLVEARCAHSDDWRDRCQLQTERLKKNRVFPVALAQFLCYKLKNANSCQCLMDVLAVICTRVQMETDARCKLCGIHSLV